MRAIEKWVDRFCRDHPRFGIPNLMLYIAIGNVVIYLLDTFSLGSGISTFLGFSRYEILHGQIWRLITFVFLPQSGDFLFFKGSGIFFVVISAYFYYWIGSLLEREWGTVRFNVFYLGGIVLNIIYGLITGYASMHYINLSLFFAFAVLYPDMQVLLFYILPVKVKWLAWIDAALFALDVVSCLLAGNWIGALLPLVAILNFFIFFWSDFMEAIGYRKRRYQHQHSQQTVNFKKATKTAYEKKDTFISAPSAVRRTRNTQTWNSATAPSATAIIATVWTISTTTSISNKRGNTKMARLIASPFCFI